ncbi:hypothetical protein ACQP2F_11565 [Actinoplanes sp. CA-030573]|uniref:hypothetical protein n=1 Tax=Actinoplanes sp. CA-030573 TaxID=3239898 RepID=UPI003D8B1C02
MDITTTAAPAKTFVPTTTILYRIAGGLLIAGPILTFAGMLTAPEQTADTTEAYVESLARDSDLTQISALFLHYSNMTMALGLIVAPLLVRGVRGRLLTLAGMLAAVLTMLNISGAVKDDWWRMVIGQTVPLDVAVRISDTVDAQTLLSPWRDTGMIGFLGLLLLYIGLARSGVLGWWAPAVYGVALVGMFTVPVSLTVAYGLVFTALFAPLAVLGLRAVNRTRRPAGA